MHQLTAKAIAAAMVLMACATFLRPVSASEFYRLTIIDESPAGSGPDWTLLGPGLGINDAGAVVYKASRVINSVPEAAIFKGDGTAVVPVAIRPGSTGSLNFPSINNLGQVAYTEIGAPTGVWIWDAGTVTNLYLCSVQPTVLVCNPETLSDMLRRTATRRALGMHPFAIVAPGGQIVAEAFLNETNFASFSPVISRDGDKAAWSGGAGGVTNSIVVIDAPPVGGIRRFIFPAPSNFVIAGLSINDLANIAFVAQGTTSTTLRRMVGVITTQSGSLGLVRVADTATSPFLDFRESPSINNLNEVAFAGQVDALNGTFPLMPAVGDVSGRTPTLVANPNEVMTADGVVFGGIRQNGFYPQSMNDRGQVAFYAQIIRGVNSKIAIVRADPAPGVSPSNPILPGPGDTLAGGGWRFRACSTTLWSQVPVRSCPPRQYYDPVLAVGYTYTVEAPGPNFKTVQIPAPLPNGDSTFQVEFDGRTAPLLAGEAFDFTSMIPGGVKTFRITGIDTAEALDPNNARAFVTGMSYVDPSITDFTITMIPIVEDPDDADLDGVQNSFDRCPNTVRGAVVDANGCSADQRDSDGDGVSDALDACPNTAIGVPVDATGCSAGQRDSDGDGVVDSLDKCPNTPPGSSVNGSGCSLQQLDSDGDGVADSVDACPNTPAKTPVDATGCPVVQQGQICDVNGDRFVDWTDIRTIIHSRGQSASGPNDPRDANRNGRIEIVDAAICTARCDRWLCRAR